MLAAEVRPVLPPGAATGADQGAVQHNHDTAVAGDLPQGPAQTRGARGQQIGHLQHPAAHGGGRDVVPHGHVSQPLVVAEHGEHDDRLDARGCLAPTGAQLLASSSYQTGNEIDGLLRHRKPNLIDSLTRALGGLVRRHTRTNLSRGPSHYVQNRPARDEDQRGR